MELTMKHVIDSINEVISEMNRIKDKELEAMINGIGQVILERGATSENEIRAIVIGSIGISLLENAQMKFMKE